MLPYIVKVKSDSEKHYVIEFLSSE